MQTTLNDLTVLFLSILLEALPFVLLGSVIAAAIGMFVSENLLYRLIPKNRLAGLVVVSFMGIAFPVCDCTVIPIMRRLIRKGLPPSLAIAFMCSVPIVNPVVIASTYWAFAGQPHIVWLRMIVGLSTAIAAGFIVSKVTRDVNPLLDEAHTKMPQHTCSCGEAHHDHAHVHAGCACGSHHHDSIHKKAEETRWNSLSNKVHGFLAHVTNEFIDSASLIVIGAFLSAAIQMLVPRTIMYPVAASPVASVASMMGFTWLISLCANADAFVAKSFYGLFTTGAVIAFMTFGQMIDLKNTMVMLGFFKKRFIVTTVIIISILCLMWGVTINLLGRGA